jgi:hypothetical protein
VGDVIVGRIKEVLQRLSLACAHLRCLHGSSVHVLLLLLQS